MPDQIYSPPIFIGREKEIALFEQMLERPEEGKWILNIYGHGGIGKTKLLENMREIVQERFQGGEHIFFTQEFVDFYWTTNQRELGVLKGIAEQLTSGDEFNPFDQIFAEYDKLIDQKEPPSPEQVYYMRDEVKERFLEGFHALTTKGLVVLLFDTAEEAGSPLENFWQDILPRLKGETLIVIAGRQKIDLLPDKETVFRQIDRFSDDETLEYFQAHDLPISTPIVSRICELAEGRPILIALAADWITHGHAPEEIVEYSTQDEFKAAMVEKVAGLQPAEESQAILAMAHLFRRFDEEVLACILDKPSDWCVNLILKLSTLSFIKYRPPAEGARGSCLLHDEMRDLVRQYAWQSVDPVENYRPIWTRKIIDYYAERIEAEQNPLERQNLNLEWLFYSLDLSLEKGFDSSRGLFTEAKNHMDADYMAAINVEVSRWENDLSPQMQKEMTFREAIVFHRREQYDQAKELMADLVKQEIDPYLKAEALARLVEFSADGGFLDEAIEYGEEGLQFCQNLLDDPVAPKSQSTEFTQTQGLLCNNSGFAYRRKGELDKAIELYKKSLDAYRDAGGPLSMIARIRNNLGYAYSQIGQSDQAISQCLTALRDRVRLGIPYELGLSYNTLGMVYTEFLRADEAVESFKRAEQAFKQARSARGQALVYVAYGRLMRQWGWYKERFAGEPFNPDREEYLRAKPLLERAVEILGKVKDRFTLVETYNELGCLYRERREWVQAEQLFNQSRELAEETKTYRRVADNLQDISILYYRQGEYDKAIEFARKASELALQEGWYYMYAKAQSLLGDMAFVKGNYENAFRALASACIYVLKHRPVSQVGQESAKTKLYYQDMSGMVDEKILALPNHRLAQKYCNFLVDEWISAGLAGAYPGFVERVRALSQDYPFLVDKEEV